MEHFHFNEAPFYEVLQMDFSALEKEISISFHSKRQHDHAWVIFQLLKAG
jgi:hypothetical protein